ncbi:MAG TPA: HD domain-containing protein, partial [Bryobacteraceae bacterium]|nr:HD domain-containing protein [Bryobacteraceae bacterium]
RQKRTGEPYLSLLLGDRSGEIEARMWDNVPDVMDTFERDDFVKVKGLFQLYNNRPQLTIHKMRRVLEHEVDFADFFPASLRDAGEMWAELRAIVSRLGNEHIRPLLDAFLDDPEVAARYRVAPAAKTIHHAFRGGLLEHVLSLCSLAGRIADHYPWIDRELLIAGAVLHDIGKIHELSYERGFGYTAEGQLLGHIAIGMRMMSDKLRAFPDFPPHLRNLLEHIILSHHGQLEFGSPKTPAFPEALLFHYLDDMDSKMECMRALLGKEPQAEGLFTPWSAALERIALRKDRYLSCPPFSSSPAADSSAAAGSAPLPASAAPDEPPPDSQPDACSAGDTNAAAAAVSMTGSPFSIPGRAPAAQPKPQPAPASNSIFGEKLQQALNDERK